jgi:hypothetical protein
MTDTEGFGVVEEFSRVDLDFANDAGYLEVYLWKRPDGMVTINTHLYRSDEDGLREATLSAADARKVIAALSSAASYVESMS